MYPFIYVFGRPIATYGICLMTGVLVASFLACRRVKKRGGSWEMTVVLATVVMCAALLGAKLAYIAFSYPGGFAGAFADIAAGRGGDLVRGGYVFYGGLIFAIPAALAVFRLGHLDTGVFCDSVVPCIPLGHAFGRIGCMLGGCCYGFEYHGPLAIWSAERPGISLFPVQPLESLLNLALFAALTVYTRKRRKGMRTLYVYLAAYAVIRFSLEFLRGDLIRGIYGAFSTSQWISIGLLCFAAAAILIQHRKAVKTADC